MPYIDRDEIPFTFVHGRFDDVYVSQEKIMQMPTADVVEQSVVDQIRWERDTAIAQLAEIGKGFGETMDDAVVVVTCRNCKKWEQNKNLPYGNCSYHLSLAYATDWCSWAERKETENGVH